MLLNIANNIKPGTTPNEIQSANESNSFPIGLPIPIKRATIPSKKSATKDIIIKIITMETVSVDTFPLLEIIKIEDKTPQERFNKVK